MDVKPDIKRMAASITTGSICNEYMSEMNRDRREILMATAQTGSNSVTKKSQNRSNFFPFLFL